MAVSMDKAHAKLSPSSAERWISCPASVQLIDKLPAREESSVYAREGTLAHGLAEIVAGGRFKLVSEEQRQADFKKWKAEFDAENYETGTFEEMHKHAMEYADLLEDRVAATPGIGVSVHLEQRMASGVEACWGTSDAVITSDSHIEIIDYKYGAGVAVSAEENAQLRLYGLGALDTFGDVLGETETVTMTVHQPRLDSVSSETLTAEELREWRSTVASPAAQEALHGEDPAFGPSASACRWCPLAGVCKPRIEAETAEVFGDLTAEEDPEPPTEPKLLSPEEVSRVLGRVKAVKDWLGAFEEAALDMAFTQGIQIPGYKVVKSGGRRSITNPVEAIDALLSAGYELDKIAVTEPKPKTLGALEKLVGKTKLPELIGDFIAKSEGRESIVPESDPRPAVSNEGEAAKAFAGEDLL